MIAIFPGTFDPFTLGHLDVTENAAKLFSKLYILVGTAAGKSALLSHTDRMNLVRDSVKHLKNVAVKELAGLTAIQATTLGAGFMVRGIRSAGDVDYELQLSAINQHLAPNVQSIFIPTKPQFRHISSTFVRDIARNGGNLQGLVSPHVAEALSRRNP
jgi:pantetheine-phosphate adenylyltransferase